MMSLQRRHNWETLKKKHLKFNGVKNSPNILILYVFTKRINIIKNKEEEKWIKPIIWLKYMGVKHYH
jgi:hypothetical protein